MNWQAAKDWATTASSGTGAAALLGTLTAVSQGHLTWAQALPVLLGALAAIAWPEKTGVAQAVQTTATDMEAMIPVLIAGAKLAQQMPAAPGPNVQQQAARQMAAAVNVSTAAPPQQP